MDDLQRAHNDWLDPDWPRRCRVPEMSEELYEDLRLEREMEMSEQNIDDGGPIYCGCVHEHPGGETVKSTPVGGLSILDYFAGLALAGLSSATEEDGSWTGFEPTSVSAAAYNIAEAMLAERKRRMGGQ